MLTPSCSSLLASLTSLCGAYPETPSVADTLNSVAQERELLAMLVVRA